MKILETIFFILMIIVPSFFVFLAVTNFKKVKTNKKFRTTIIKIIFLTLIVNGVIWGVLRYSNTKENKVDNPTQDLDGKNDGKDEEEESSDEKDEEKPTKPSEPDKPTTTEPPPNPSTDPDTPTSKPTNDTDVTSKGFAIETKDGITYVDGYLIVNKTYSLPENYVPTNTYKTVNTANCTDCLDKTAIDAYNKMKSDASANGLTLWIASGFRSYGYQTALYNGYVKANGKTAADTYSARPGHSEHQSGFAFDLNTVSESFASTKEGIWVNQNCHKYGFIIRYPKGKDSETGYIYEPWHLRYVGEDLATKLFNGGDWITMETYFGITSTYQE